jgi:acyl transferase domain-containing protein/acyl carrier protein
MLAAGIQARVLATSHAFHSSLMAHAAVQFEQVASRVAFKPPSRPFLSNVTGDWITASQATSPSYWAAHLRGTVRFGDALDRLIAMPEWMLLEVGPGTTLSALARQHPSHRAEQPVVATMRHARDRKDDDRVLLDSVADLWASGVDVDWSGVYDGETRRRVHLPTYPFERRRYWIDARPLATATTSAGDAGAKRQDIGAWLYRPAWTTRAAVGAPPHGARHWLVLSDGPLGAALAGRLRASGDSVTVAATAAAACSADHRVSPVSVDEYAELLDTLDRLGRPPDVIVHAWGVEPAAPDLLAFDTLLPLGRALARRPSRPVRLLVAATGLAAVTGDDAVVPEKATLLGPVTVIPQELPHVRCRAVDLDASAADGDAAVRALVAEAAVDSTETLVAYRSGERWTRDVVPIDGSATAVPFPLRERGVYLVTGGTRGIGLVLAAHLARVARARLVLVSRTPVPDRAQWDDWCTSHDATDRARRTIEQVRAIEEAGGEVLVAAADVADLAQMEAVRAQALARFGAIHGVIHSAGIAGGGMLQLKTPEMARRVLAPKVAGIRVLEQVLRNDSLDVLVLCSSLASMLGGFGQVDYSAANAFLDAYARVAPTRLRVARAVSIDWDTWQETGMAVDTEVPRELAAARDGHLRLGMTNAEGAAVLGRALACPDAQVIVSTRDWQSRTAIGGSQPPPAAVAVPSPAEKHDRPSLPSSYVAPRSDAESFVAATWADTLGVDPIGVDDDFFALGGHSLLAIQIAARVKEHFGVDVPVQLIFDAPTVAELTARVQELAGDGHPDAQQYADMVDFVGQLSDEDVRRMLGASEPEHRP